jgi:hypothetical protein
LDKGRMCMPQYKNRALNKVFFFLLAQGPLRGTGAFIIGKRNVVGHSHG